MIDEIERDWISEEIEVVTERRERMLAARAKNGHLDHWKTDIQLGILDRQLAELQDTAA